MMILSVSPALSLWKAPEFVELLAKIPNLAKFKILPIHGIILNIYPDPTHIHPQDLSPRFVHHNSCLPYIIRILVKGYLEASWGQSLLRREIC